MSKEHALTHERLLEVLEYNKDTGEFTAKTFRSGNRKNQVGSTRKDGYKRIGIDYHNFLAHRLAWFYVYKEWPNVIDHIDGNPSNNSISNLRNVDQKVNCRNFKSATSRNKVGLLGVSFCKRDKLWRARLKHDHGHFCRYFKTKEEAYAAYVEAKKKYHKEFI